MKGCNKSMKTLMVILKTKRKNEENEEQSHDHSESVHNKKQSQDHTAGKIMSPEEKYDNDITEY